MATAGRQTPHRRPHRPYHLRTHRVRTLSQQDYENRRDCCCHKLGRLRPHLAVECRDIP